MVIGDVVAESRQGPGLGQIYSLDVRVFLFFTYVWVLVAVHPERKDLFLAVPADNSPLLAGDEVAVPESKGSGALTMRCEFCLWIPARDLQSYTLKGAIGESQIREAHQVILAVANGRREGREPGAVRVASEHQDWIRAIANAQNERSIHDSHDQDARRRLNIRSGRKD